ncbi:hypothetical protein Z946_680 [Sulfitobacter noctilucicola]|nr:hypothetical protein Z946_680 [Sulfitobacter noctilucicola]
MANLWRDSCLSRPDHPHLIVELDSKPRPERKKGGDFSPPLLNF